MLLQSLIETPEEVRRAADHQVRLQELLLAAGGIAGPGTIGDPWAPEVPGADEGRAQAS